MRNALLKTTLGLSVIVASIFTAKQANAQSWIELGYNLGGAGAESSYELCAGVSGGSMTDGTVFKLWNCNANESNGYTGARDQALSVDTSDCIESGGFFYCSIRDANNYNKCMGVSGGSKSDQAAVKIWDCLGPSHPDQYWLLFPDDSTGCKIVYNYNSDMRLDLGTGSLVQSSNPYSTSEWCPRAVSP